MRTYRRRPRLGPLAEPEDLHDRAAPRAPCRRGPRPAELDGWVVTDTWPERIPVTEAEVELFERHFDDVRDALVGAVHHRAEGAVVNEQRAALDLRVSTGRQAEHDRPFPTSAGSSRPTAVTRAGGSSPRMSSRAPAPPTTAGSSCSA